MGLPCALPWYAFQTPEGGLSIDSSPQLPPSAAKSMHMRIHANQSPHITSPVHSSPVHSGPWEWFGGPLGEAQAGCWGLGV